MYLVVFVDGAHAGTDLISQKVVCPKCIEIHVTTHGQQLWAIQIINRQFVSKKPRHTDHL